MKSSSSSPWKILTKPHTFLHKYFLNCGQWISLLATPQGILITFFTNYCTKKISNHSTKSQNLIKFYPKNLYRFTQSVNMLFINLSITFQQIQNVSTHPNTPQFVSRTPYPTTCLFASKITHHINKYSINIYKKWLTKKPPDKIFVRH